MYVHFNSFLSFLQNSVILNKNNNSSYNDEVTEIRTAVKHLNFSKPNDRNFSNFKHLNFFRPTFCPTEPLQRRFSVFWATFVSTVATVSSTFPVALKTSAPVWRDTTPHREIFRVKVEHVLNVFPRNT